MKMIAESGPCFEAAPVIETALSVQFDELPLFRACHFGLFYELIRADFPRVEDKPRLEAVREHFPLRPVERQLRFTQAGTRLGRVWFSASEESPLLLQLQADRISLNWIDRVGTPYARYEDLKPRLLQKLSEFADFAATEGLGEVKPNLCEAIYVNKIIPEKNEAASECMAAVLTSYACDPATDFLQSSPRVAAVNEIYDLPDDRGRLYVETSVTLDRKHGDSVAMQLTGRINRDNSREVAQDLDAAHDCVVRGFEALTTKDARLRRWRQVQ